MGQFNAFRNDMNILVFMAYAEAAIWAYFLIQLGLFLARFGELKAYFRATGPEEQPPYALIYLKRAGTALVVAGALKILATLYSAIITKGNFESL